MTRRKFLTLGALTLPVIAADTLAMAPTRLRVSKLNVNEPGTCRFVHFSDLHYAGDAHYAAEVVETINALDPQFACFTGDLVEDRKFATEALSFIEQIRKPVYGIPGNHDYWSQAPFDEYERAFAKTGGAWMPDRRVALYEHDIELVGMGVTGMPAVVAEDITRHVLLLHYPVMADHLGTRQFDLILAGHSHGGQVRLPFVGALSLPLGVGVYDYGRYDTPGGLLYVNAGIGTLSQFPVRFNCPPEITVVTI
ncbi:MAG: metallophosphoesterase [Verrucomicrobiota bacterium]